MQDPAEQTTPDRNASGHNQPINQAVNYKPMQAFHVRWLFCSATTAECPTPGKPSLVYLYSLPPLGRVPGSSYCPQQPPSRRTWQARSPPIWPPGRLLTGARWHF